MATKEPNRLSFDFKDHPGLCDRLRQKCLEENLPMTTIVAQLIERWLNEGIDLPQTVDDKICPKIYGLFKEHCPDFSIPDFNQDLVEQIKMSLARTHQKEEWYVDLFKRAASIPWTGWQPNFEWLLKFENSLRILDGNYDRMIFKKEHEKHAEERRKAREAERTAKEQARKEEAERKVKEKKEKRNPEAVEAKKKEEEKERLQKEKEALWEKQSKEPQWNEVVYMDENGREIGGWVYPSDWTEEQKVDWELKRESHEDPTERLRRMATLKSVAIQVRTQRK